MATTVVAASATVKHTVELTLAGKTFDVEYTKIISGVTRADRNIVPVPTSEVDIIQLFAAAINKGTFEDFDHFSIINRDDTNFVRIRIIQAGGDTADFRLDPGEWMVLWNSKIEVNTTGAAFGAFTDFETIKMEADTAEVDIEYIAFQV